MTCSRCHRSFDQDSSELASERFRHANCPHCGARYDRPVSAVLKTSTILISADTTDAVYHSLDDVPEPLKAMLLQSTNGLNSGTILIADRGGKEQISSAVRNMPSATQKKLRESVPGSRLASLASQKAFGWPVRYWTGLLIVLVTGVLAWLISTWHW